MAKIRNLVLLETKEQVQEFIKTKERYSNALVISMHFDAEYELERAGILFKSSDDYENEETYKNIDEDSINLANKIIKIISFKYRNIDIPTIFSWDLTYFCSFILQRIILIKKIISLEKPNKIIVFDTKQRVKSITVSKYETLYSSIVPLIFKNTEINFFEIIDKENKKIIVKVADKFQNLLAKYNLFFSKKDKIAFIGAENIFKEVISKLPKEYGALRFRDSEGKSSFISGRYVPFVNLRNFIKYDREEIKLSEKQVNLLKKLKFKNLALFEVIEERVRFMVSKYSYYIELIDVINSFLINNNIKLLVLYGDSTTFEKLSVLVARNLKIPSFVIQHGITGHKIGFVPLSASYICVYGKESERFLIKNKISKKRIVLTGSPRYDFFKPLKSRKTNKILFTPQVSNRETFFPNYHITLKQRKNMTKIIFNVIKKSKYKLIISIRPGDKLENLYHNIAKKLRFKNYEMFYGSNIVDAINNSDIVITPFSTVGIEALLLGKKLINITDKKKELVPYSKYKASITVHNEKELSKALKTLQAKYYSPDIFLKNYLYTTSNSTENIINLIKKLI